MLGQQGLRGSHSARHRKPFGRCQATSTATTVKLARPRGKVQEDAARLEQQLLDALQGAKGRGKEGLSDAQLAALNDAVERLEAIAGVPNPTADPQLDGAWRLLFTSRPGTASPIQRTFTGVESFSIFQEVDLQGEEARVNNVVDFGKVGYLKVEAQASTDSRPLEGFTPREGTGDFLFGVFGTSQTYPPARPNMRVDFQFDKAAFYFNFLPFSIPYPVPFRILGDERKGWIDVTYMNASRTLRLSRGNKGTLFVLVKDIPLKEQLRKAIKESNDEEVLRLIDTMAEQNPTAKPARSPLAAGTWRLVWTQQAANASALQKFGTKQASSYQVIEEGSLENVVNLGPARLFAKAECSPASDTRTTVRVADTGVTVGPVTVPLPGAQNNATPGFVDWLWLDEDMRITRGSKGSLFVHYREDDNTQA